MSSVYSQLKTARSVTLRYTRSFSVVCLMLLSQPVLAETLFVDQYQVEARIAITPEEQHKGLQGVRALGENEGMLFIFIQKQKVCMWMKDVPIDLDVGFFDENGRLIDVHQMKTQTRNTHCSPQEIKWALEMPGGWFEKRKLREGAQLRY